MKTQRGFLRKKYVSKELQLFNSTYLQCAMDEGKHIAHNQIRYYNESLFKPDRIDFKTKNKITEIVPFRE